MRAMAASVLKIIIAQPNSHVDLRWPFALPGDDRGALR